MAVFLVPIFGGKNSEKEFILNQWTGLQNIAEAVYNIKYKFCLVFCSLFGPYNPCIWLEIVEADTPLPRFFICFFSYPQ